MKIQKTFRGFGSALDPLRGLTAPPPPPPPPPPPKPQLIIVIAARSFSQNSKKTRPTNFSLI